MIERILLVILSLYCLGLTSELHANKAKLGVIENILLVLVSGKDLKVIMEEAQDGGDD